jgi:hypothetical protein
LPSIFRADLPWTTLAVKFALICLELFLIIWILDRWSVFLVAVGLMQSKEFPIILLARRFSRTWFLQPQGCNHRMFHKQPSPTCLNTVWTWRLFHQRTCGPYF